MTKRFHPCLLLLLFYGLGIICGSFFPLSPVYPGYALAGLLAWLILRGRSGAIGTIILLASMFFIGYFLTISRDYVAEDDLRRLPFDARRQVIPVEGVVVSEVSQREFFSSRKTLFEMEIGRVKFKGRWIKRRGKVIVQVFRPVALEYGDAVSLEGRLHPPFVNENDGPTSYKDYLNIRGIHYMFSVKKEGRVERLEAGKGNPVKAGSLRSRKRLSAVFDRYFTVNESGLMKAVILGERSHVPDHVNELFLRTGTVHVLAISGFNVGIVAALFLMVLRFFPLPRRVCFGAVILLLAGYCYLTGAAPSVLRATIMIIILFFGAILEKEPQPFNTLAAAAMIILIHNPPYLFDVGFQLSFVCVAAIFVLAPWLAKDEPVFEEMLGWETNFSRWLWHSLLLSLGIWIAVAGLIAYYFRIVTPVTVLANLAVVPLVGAVIALGFLLIAAAWIAPWAGVWVALTLKAALNGMVASIFLFDQLPWGSFFLKNVSLWQLTVYYAIVFSGFILGCRIDKARQL